MSWNSVCWWIATAARNHSILAIFCTAVDFPTFTETVMPSFWWNFHHWLHWKLSKWQLPVQPVIKISSKRRHFRFSVCRKFWLSKFVQIWGFLAFYRKCMEGTAWNLVCRYILASRKDLILVMVCWFSYFGRKFDLSNGSYLWFPGIYGKHMAGMVWKGERRHISDALRRVLSICHWF